VKLRCYLLSLLRIHQPDCKHCVARKRYGMEMRKRLEELNWRVQPCSPKEMGVFDSERAEVITLPVSLARRGKKSA
jgi:hypothetical protein